MEELYNMLVLTMKECGWNEVSFGAGFTIQGPDGQEFGDWASAIKACIEVASGC